jgi:hypothetical protein
MDLTPIEVSRRAERTESLLSNMRAGHSIRVIDSGAHPPNGLESALGRPVETGSPSARTGPIEEDPAVQPSDAASQAEQVCEVGDRARSPSAIAPPHVLQVP